MKRLAVNPEWAQENFDVCVYMEANIFNVYYKELMLEQAEMFQTLGIPIYLLGCGAQSGLDYNTDFVDEIEEYAKSYLDAILKSANKGLENVVDDNHEFKDYLSKKDYRKVM